MARSQARIHTSVWRNPDFTALPRSTQGLYWMLLSQPDVSLAGVAPLVERRWRKLSTDKPDDLDTDLDLLSEHGFVVVDEDCGEVWIRSFVRYDGVLASEKTRAGMWSAYKGIMSCRIRVAFLAGIGAENTLEARERDWVSEADLKVENPPSDTPSDTPSPRARADSDSTSYSTSDNKTPRVPPDGEDTPDETEQQFAKWWEAWPDRNGKKRNMGKALSAFKALSIEQRRRAWTGAKNYAASGEGPMDAFRFLRKDTAGDFPFDDWQTPGKRASGQGQRASPHAHTVSEFTESGRVQP